MVAAFSDADAALIADRQIELGGGIALLCRPAVPVDRNGVILGTPLAIKIFVGQFQLRFDIAFFSQYAQTVVFRINRGGLFALRRFLRKLLRPADAGDKQQRHEKKQF